MKVHVTEIEPYGSPLLVALVPSDFTNSTAGPGFVKRLQPYYKFLPIMLVSVETNGFRAYAAFQTHVLLALIQLEYLNFEELDLSTPPPDEELPF